MTMLNFDARTVAPQVTLEPIPQGWYKVVISKSNIKPTNKGDGGYLDLVCQVIDGQFTGRQVHWNLNLWNPSQQAVEIAYKQLSAICHVIGQFQVQSQNVDDTATPTLHNQPFCISVVVTQGEKGPINNIKGCKDVYGNDPGKTAGAGAGAGGAPMVAQPGAPPAGFPQGGFAPPGQPAAPVGPGGQQWQPGTNTAPQPGGFAQPAAPAAPAPAWAANVVPMTPGAPVAPQPPQQPVNQQWGTGPATQPAPPVAPPNQGWTQGGQPAAPGAPGAPAGGAPWQRT